jgi:hypothetical protein
MCYSKTLVGAGWATMGHNPIPAAKATVTEKEIMGTVKAVE